MNTRAPLRGPIAFWALAGLTLLVSHDAVFLVQVGPGEALTRALRDASHEYWGAVSLALAAIGALAAVAANLRMRRLRREAAQLGATAAGGSSFLRRLPIVWARLFAVIAVGFVVQESLEHLGMHGHAIGLGALAGPEYPLAIPVLAVITLVAAAVATLVSGAEDALVACIDRARRLAEARAPRRVSRAPLVIRGHRVPVLARLVAGRAPPRTFVPNA